ncbi:MAG: hypothetical protein A3F11_01790 [Gammaproteobacteria bacterium RIFCSPHIGHO2_12_FULL_37_14]|nr:MAG: hypothetical protein A3F11_01790 [Gammaproteobacteria bacterium RIFCSPHIGHO2_12_FULL_37_14]
MKNMFTEHLHSIGETYFQHFKFALKFGICMLIGGMACIIHAIFPFLFENLGSDYLLKMTTDFVNRLSKLDARTTTLLEILQKKAKR